MINFNLGNAVQSLVDFWNNNKKEILTGAGIFTAFGICWKAMDNDFVLDAKFNDNHIKLAPAKTVEKLSSTEDK